MLGELFGRGRELSHDGPVVIVSIERDAKGVYSL